MTHDPYRRNPRLVSTTWVYGHVLPVSLFGDPLYYTSLDTNVRGGVTHNIYDVENLVYVYI